MITDAKLWKPYIENVKKKKQTSKVMAFLCKTKDVLNNKSTIAITSICDIWEPELLT